MGREGGWLGHESVGRRGGGDGCRRGGGLLGRRWWKGRGRDVVDACVGGLCVVGGLGKRELGIGVWFEERGVYGFRVDSVALVGLGLLGPRFGCGCGGRFGQGSVGLLGAARRQWHGGGLELGREVMLSFSRFLVW